MLCRLIRTLLHHKLLAFNLVFIMCWIAYQISLKKKLPYIKNK